MVGETTKDYFPPAYYSQNAHSNTENYSVIQSSDKSWYMSKLLSSQWGTAEKKTAKNLLNKAIQNSTVELYHWFWWKAWVIFCFTHSYSYLFIHLVLLPFFVCFGWDFCLFEFCFYLHSANFFRQFGMMFHEPLMIFFAPNSTTKLHFGQNKTADLPCSALSMSPWT